MDADLLDFYPIYPGKTLTFWRVSWYEVGSRILCSVGKHLPNYKIQPPSVSIVSTSNLTQSSGST
jgi:hypothetical protein